MKPDGTYQQFYTYGDKGYAPGNGIVVASHRQFFRRMVTAEQEAENQAMMSYRVAVENYISRIKEIWGIFVSLEAVKKQHGLREMIFTNSVFLTNCIHCVETVNQINSNRDVYAPDLDDYLDRLG